MSLFLAYKASTPLAALLRTPSRTGHAEHLRMTRFSLPNHLILRPNAATQLRHLGGNSQVRPQTSATASDKPASQKKEGRLSVLDRMGANRTTKIVIIVFLSVYATMETLFYANAAYRYFSKEEGDKADDSVSWVRPGSGETADR